MAAQELRERLERVPGDGRALVDREVPERFDEVALAGPATGRRRKAPRARSIHSSVLSACWVAAGIADRLGFPGVERLAGRQPGRAPACPDRCLVAAGGLLGEQHLEDLGVLPALAGRGRDHLRRRPADVWEPRRRSSRSSSSGSGGGGGGLTVIARSPVAFELLGELGQRQQLERELPRTARVDMTDHRRNRLPGRDVGVIAHDQLDLLHATAVGIDVEHSGRAERAIW